MDKNKKDRLREVGYVVRRTCENCRHVQIGAVRKAWGICTVQTYEHAKHTDNPRSLSIYVSGYCPKHEWLPDAIRYIEGYAEFMEDET